MWDKLLFAGEGDGEQANGLNKREIHLSGLFFLILFCSVCSRSNPPSPLPVFLSAVVLSFIKKKGRQKLEAVNKHICGEMIDDIAKSAIIVKPILFISSSYGSFALFLFWKRKTTLKEKQARGRHNPSFPRTNRSRAPTTSSGTVFSPLPDPPVRGKSREDQALPSRASPAINNRSLAGYRSQVRWME